MTLREFTAKVGQRDGSITVVYETARRNGCVRPELFGDRWTRAPYRIGDRIRIGQATGDVIEVGYLDTTLWEFGGEFLGRGSAP